MPDSSRPQTPREAARIATIRRLFYTVAVGLPILILLAAWFGGGRTIYERLAFKRFCSSTIVTVYPSYKDGDRGVRDRVWGPWIDAFGVDAFRDPDFLAVVGDRELFDPPYASRVDAECAEILRHAVARGGLKDLSFDAAPVRLEALRDLPRLTELDAFDFRHEALDGSVARLLGGARRLQYVTIEVRSVADADLCALRGCPRLVRLRFLGGPDPERAFERGDQPSAPASSLITDAGFRCLEEMTELQELTIGPCFATEAAMASLSKLDRLEELVITGGRLNRAAIEALGGCERLRRASFYSFQVEADALGGLAALPKLESIDFCDCDVGEETRGFDAAPQLEGGIGFNQCRVSAASIERLRAAWPHVEVWTKPP